MSRATIDSAGTVRVAVRRAPDRTVAARDVQDPEKLARTIQDLRSMVDALDAPLKSVTFEDVTVAAAGALVSLPHRFGGRVRWWLVDWASDAGGVAPILETDSTTDENTLVLASSVAGTASILIEAAG